MDKKELKKILFPIPTVPHTESTKADFLVLINFIYNPTNTIKSGTSLLETTKSGISENNKKIIIPNESELNSDISLTAEYVLKQVQTEENFVNNWISVSNKVKDVYETYLDQLISKNEEVEFILFSEAPLLGWKEGKVYSNYILDDCKVPGSYRSAPFKAIKKIKSVTDPKYNDINGPNLMSLFIKHNVAFIDLIPIPLPQLNAEFRTKNAENLYFSLDGTRPRTIDLLELATNHFFEKSSLKISENVKLAFMMPPKMADGIFNWIIHEKNIPIFEECNLLNHLFSKHNLKDIAQWRTKNGLDEWNNPNAEMLAKAFEIK
jgi:hypothetical protein